MDPWEGLQIEHDVLESFLKKCDSSSSLIPAIMNRISDDPRTTQQFAEEVAQATYEIEFNSNAWKWAEIHLSTANLGSTLHLVVGIVKDCRPNGLGDMLLTLKASLHRKDLKDPNFGPHIGLVFPANICPPTKELVMETPKPVISPLLPEEPNVAEIMRKLRPPFLQLPSTSKAPQNNNTEKSNAMDTDNSNEME
ncbi:hypothetical protein V8G54_024022 [Vigna mungo]|uniref:Uncharacterized protein n=1 Tax=Vigna mungo TaxID=3915 RepID=A0AAQ3N6I7_VIGMU